MIKKNKNVKTEDRLIKTIESKNKKLNEVRKTKEINETSGCTFSPQVNDISSKII